MTGTGNVLVLGVQMENLKLKTQVAITSKLIWGAPRLSNTLPLKGVIVISKMFKSTR